MNVYDYIIIAAVAVWLTVTAVITVKRRKKHPFCGNCRACGGCRSECDKKRGENGKNVSN